MRRIFCGISNESFGRATFEVGPLTLQFDMSMDPFRGAYLRCLFEVPVNVSR